VCVCVLAFGLIIHLHTGPFPRSWLFVCLILLILLAGFLLPNELF